MQKISDKELLLQLTGIYEVLDGFRATMNGYYDMKDEIMVPFHLALTDEQTDQINRGGYEAGYLLVGQVGTELCQGSAELFYAGLCRTCGKTYRRGNTSA